MVVFYIGTLFTFNWEIIFFVGIYILMLINNRKNLFDLILTILALTLSIANLFVKYNLLGIS